MAVEGFEDRGLVTGHAVIADRLACLETAEEVDICRIDDQCEKERSERVDQYAIEFEYHGSR